MKIMINLSGTALVHCCTNKSLKSGTPFSAAFQPISLLFLEIVLPVYSKSTLLLALTS